jgi:1-acyl-sn-glycerol-3-phosphate acyltransferase
VRTFFEGDRYVTPPHVAWPVLRFLSGSWRWFFYPQYFAEVLNARHLARKGVYDDAEWAESSRRVMNIIERNGGRFDIRGLDNLRNAAPQAPFVFIGNHMSTLETQVYPVLIAPFMPVTFVVKKELLEHPFMGPVLETRDPIPVERRSAREDLKVVLEGGRARLSRGMSLVVFPQHTRTPQFDRGSFNSLGTRLAASAGVQAIPVAVKSDFWGEHGKLRGFGPVRPERTIHIEFGEPIEVHGRGRGEHEYIVEFIETRLKRWRESDGET